MKVVTAGWNGLRVGASEQPTRRITDYGRTPLVFVSATSQGGESVRVNMTADQARQTARRLKAYADFISKEA